MATRKPKRKPDNPEASRQSKGNQATQRQPGIREGNASGRDPCSTVETRAHGRQLPFPDLQSGRTCVIGTVMRSIEAFDLNGRRREFTILSDEELL